MADVVLIHPTLEHEPEFLAAVARSRRLHRPWVSPPSTPAAFREYLAKAGAERTIAHLVRHRDGGLVGVINVSEIVRGVFQSAYLGYYAFEPLAGRGLMRQAMVRRSRRRFATTASTGWKPTSSPTTWPPAPWCSGWASSSRAFHRGV